MGRSSVPDKDKTFISSPKRPYRLWGPLCLLFNGYRGLFQNGRSVRPNTHPTQYLYSTHTLYNVNRWGKIYILPSIVSWNKKLIIYLRFYEICLTGITALRKGKGKVHTKTRYEVPEGGGRCIALLFLQPRR